MAFSARGMRLQFKIFVFFMILLVPSLLSVSAGSYLWISGQLTESITSASAQRIMQIRTNLDVVLHNMELFASLFTNNARLRRLLLSNSEPYLDAARSFDQYIRDIFQPFNWLGVESTVVGANGRVFYTYGSLSINPERLRSHLLGSPYWESLVNHRDAEIWGSFEEPFEITRDGPAGPRLTLFRPLYAMDTPRVLGMVVISIPLARVSNLLSTIEGSAGESAIGIWDPVSAAPIVEPVDAALQTRAVEALLPGEAEGAVTVQNGDTQMLLTYETLETSGFVVYELVPSRVLFADVLSALPAALILLGVVTLSAALVAAFVSQNITRPLKRLVGSMSNVDSLELGGHPRIEGSIEIRELGQSFNAMLSRIRSLVRVLETEQSRKSAIQLENKQMELDLLQAQINPHFLFNTLNSIKWMAMIDKSHAVAESIAALGRILEMSIPVKNNLISLAEELDNAECYHRLMLLKYPGLSRLVVSMPDELSQVRVPKLVFQPLIENSILHGFGSGKRKGTVTISSAARGDLVEVQVRDDGFGSPQEELSRLFDEDRTINTRRDGIGLVNVHRRLKATFDANPGLAVESTPDEGFLCRFEVPLSP